MLRKRIIITADDFGLAEGINAGIAEAFESGIVKSASLVAGGRAFESAVKIAKNTGLDVGVHFSFLEEKPVLESEKIPFIVGKDGYFFSTLPAFISALYLNKQSLKNIESEARAQIEKILDAGIKPSFLNSHRHLHMLPKLFRQFVSLADRYGIKAIRLPNEYIIRKDLLNKHALLRWPGVFLLKYLGAFNRRHICEGGLKYNDYSAGILRSGHLDLEAARDILREALPETTEFICHLGIYEDSMSVYKHWRYNWQEELAVFLSPELKKCLEEQNIELISFKEL